MVLAGEHRPQPLRVTREPATGLRLFGDPRLGLGEEAGGEEDHRRDPRPCHRAHHVARPRHRRGEGLVQQQMTTGPGGPDREVRLHVRRYRHRHRVHLGEQLVHVVEGPRAVTVRQFLRGGGAPAPHPDEVETLVCGQNGRVDHLRPGAGAEQTDAHAADSPCCRSG
jgi:hypothetical protein